MKAWMRVLEVYLSRKGKDGKLSQIRFGTNWQVGKDDLKILVSGKKNLSSVSDTCTISISNLSYKEMIEIVNGNFFDVEVKCGYRNGNVFTVFKGGILYISNKLNSVKTNTVKILCGSELVAKYSQQRINFTIASGMNLYSALKYVAMKAEIPNSNISKEFRNKFFNQVLSENESVGSWLDKLGKTNPNFIINSDASNGSSFSIYDCFEKHRIINLNEKNIELESFPKLSSNGLNLTIIPTMNFTPGDMIKIDNSLIDISTTNRSDNNAIYLDSDGIYMIYSIRYTLANRASEFSFELDCKAKNLVTNLTGKKV